MKNKLIAYCGLDCSKCEAYIATKNNDDTLREKVAESWSKLNQVTITKEMINCEGCRTDGVKTPFCDKLCPIKNCASEKKKETCGSCLKLDSCEKLKMIISTNVEAYERLKRGK